MTHPTIEEIRKALANKRDLLAIQYAMRFASCGITDVGRRERSFCYGRDSLAPMILELVEKSRAYLNAAPVDGWHFTDCDSAEDSWDEEMPCSCGVGVKEVELKSTLAKFYEEIGLK